MEDIRFECDQDSKADFIESVEDYIHCSYSGFTCEWYGLTRTEDGTFERVPLGEESPTERMDLALTLKNKDNQSATYAIELKERLGRYVSSYYGEEGQQGWAYNIEKDNVLKEAQKQGYIPLYGNLYPDGKIRIWNIKKLGELPTVAMPIHRWTVKEGELLNQTRYTLMNGQGITIERKSHRYDK